jgi:adenylate cyclase
LAVRESRKLAAVMAVDVVAYSRLVGADEADTLARVKSHRVEFAEPLLAEYRGRVVKLTGDGGLVEFASAVDAVECAVALQEGMAAREAAEPEERRIRFRIGINIGDIVVDDDDIFGDGVNVAARLEGLADPGGICIARNVYDQVKSKLDPAFQSMGEQRVKNIMEPIAVYRVGPGPRAPVRGSPLRARWRAASATVAVLLAMSAGGVWYALWQPGVQSTESSSRSASEDSSPKRLSEQPSIAVLPFDNFGSDPEMDYFGDGLAEDIIIGLSQSPDLLVVSRNTSFAYRGGATDVRKIGQELGVQYVLEGSVRKNDNTLRVTAQLIDAATGLHVWAERYDNEDADVFLLQDDVNSRIINTLLGPRGVIRTAEYERSLATDDSRLRAYDYHVRGHQLYWRFTKADMIRAREIWLEGLEEFPDSGLLRVHVGWSYLSDVQRGWSTDAQADLKRALEFARAGLAKEDLPRIGQLYGHWLLAYLSVWYLRDFDQAIAEAEKTLALYPGFSDSLASLCTIFLFAGQPDDALKNIDEAIRRANPSPPNHYYRYKGWAHFMLEDYEQAVVWLRKRKAYDLPARRLLAASYAHLGRLADATAVVTEIRENHPDLTIAALSEVLPYRRPEDLERELAGLGRAGLPPG